MYGSARARIACLAPVLFVLFVAIPSNLSAQMRKELRVGAPGVPAALDPASALEGTVPLIARQVFDTLVTYRDGSTDIGPSLATRWSVSRDGLVWSFTLRDGVRFHDGSALTAQDVVASLERHMKPDSQAPSIAGPALLRGSPGVIKQVLAPNARTVQIVLVQPYAPLLTVLAHPGLAIVRPSTALDGSPRFLGTGPYRVVDASAGRLAIEAVPGHWAGEPRTARIVFLEVASDDQADAAFDARELDIWFPAEPPRRAEWALAIPGLRVGYLAFQTEKEPFSRRRIRQAVAAALDPAVIGLALGRAAVPLQSFLPSAVWARREGSPIFGGTRETVRTLLREGGWPKGFTPTMVAPAYTMPVNLPKLAEALQLMLGAADIPIQLRVEPPEVARAALEAGEHDLAVVEDAVVGGDPHLFLYPLSTSEGATKGRDARNVSFYRNPKLDDVLIRASQLAFRPERQRLYQRAQAILAEELPWVPLYVRLLWAVARPEVHGLRLQPTGLHRLDSVTLETEPAPSR